MKLITLILATIVACSFATCDYSTLKDNTILTFRTTANGGFLAPSLLTREESIALARMTELAYDYTGVDFSSMTKEDLEIFTNLQKNFWKYRQSTDGVDILRYRLNEKCNTEEGFWLPKQLRTSVITREEFVGNITMDYTKSSVDSFILKDLSSKATIDCSDDDVYLALFNTLYKLASNWQYLVLDVMAQDIETRMVSTDSVVVEQAKQDLELIYAHTVEFTNKSNAITKRTCTTSGLGIQLDPVYSWYTQTKALVPV